jgi:hypothetical protein
VRRYLPIALIAAVFVVAIVAGVTLFRSRGIDRTPVIFVNGEKVAVTERNEKGLPDAIGKALEAQSALTR